ncbi:SMC-Scp complex subunit ScpB [Paenarthrobacter sp. Z7-10]|nr:SMC-Scp complex subunit ScpB [Paenarthrobacter sp. Z7-10]
MDKESGARSRPADDDEAAALGESVDEPLASSLDGSFGDPLNMDHLPGGARAALEAVLMVVDEPVEESALAAALGRPLDDVRQLLAGLQREYDGYTRIGHDGVPAGNQDDSADFVTAPRGYELRNVAGGWRIYSRPEFSALVSRFIMDGQSARLTQAALETMAVIAYRQPVSRARVSAIRGVNVDSVVRTLIQRGLIEEAGTDPESGAFLYRTTQFFLERIGVGSVDELPRLAPHLPGLENLHDFEDSPY